MWAEAAGPSRSVRHHVREDFESKPRQLFGWHALVMQDGSIQCEPYFYLGKNPKARWRWVGDESDGDDGFLSFKVGPSMPVASGEYVEARGADQVLWGCFRRGSKVYRSGLDYGCPQPNPRIVRTSTEPDLPVEVPGKPGEIGTCWDPVEQPIEAAQLFPGCLALDKQGVLHQLHVLRPPVELDRGVRFAMTLEDRRILIVRDDGSATVQDGNGYPHMAPSPDPLPAGPPTPIELKPVRALFPEGVIFEDGTASMFWSEDQLLRRITGVSDPVELAGGSGICVRTEARTLHCHHGLSTIDRRQPEAAPLVLEPAVFDASRTR